MKFTLSWLKEHLDTDSSLENISETLTRIGLEVEGVEDKAAALKPYVIAKILTAEQHPNADRLRVCAVDTGVGEPVQVVCGAPDARAGLVSVFAPPGTYVPGKNITLREHWQRKAQPMYQKAEVSVPGRLHFAVFDFTQMEPGLGGGGLGVSTSTVGHQVVVSRTAAGSGAAGTTT